MTSSTGKVLSTIFFAIAIWVIILALSQAIHMVLEWRDGCCTASGLEPTPYPGLVFVVAPRPTMVPSHYHLTLPPLKEITSTIPGMECYGYITDRGGTRCDTWGPEMDVYPGSLACPPCPCEGD